MCKPFNVRVYGLLIVQNQLLVIQEPFMGKMIRKFPGGGLEFGEGTRDCLKRELKEELNLEVEVKEHFYTQDFFMQSGLKSDEQILMIYYKLEVQDISQLKVIDQEIEELIWIDLEELSPEDLSLQTDQLVVKMFLESL